MNVFNIGEGYRYFGISYGLPVYFVDIGFGMRLTPDDVVKKLMEKNIGTGRWVVIRGSLLKEQGGGVLVDLLTRCKTKVEVEDDGSGKAPAWFPSVDRWVVEWKDPDVFNYGALRANRDMLILKSDDLEEQKKFVDLSSKMPGIKAIVTSNPKDSFKLARVLGVRVYEPRGESYL